MGPVPVYWPNGVISASSIALPNTFSGHECKISIQIPAEGTLGPIPTMRCFGYPAVFTYLLCDQSNRALSWIFPLPVWVQTSINPQWGRLFVFDAQLCLEHDQKNNLWFFGYHGPRDSIFFGFHPGFGLGGIQEQCKNELSKLSTVRVIYDACRRGLYGLGSVIVGQ